MTAMVLPLRDGILPTPKSSKINSKDSTSFISPSTYPLPYEAVQIINSFNICEQPKWNISVGTKNIKLKMEWLTINTHMDKSTTFNFPATVLHSISLFNLDKPTWSSSFNGQEVLLNCDWKIINKNSTPSQFNTPSQSAATLYNSPDSGYHTGSPPTTYTPYTAQITPTKLKFSPTKRKKNDIFIPKTPKPSNSPPQTPHQPTPSSQKQPNLPIIKPPTPSTTKKPQNPPPTPIPSTPTIHPNPPTNKSQPTHNIPSTSQSSPPLTSQPYPYKPSSSTTVVINPDAPTANQDYDPMRDFVPKYNKFAQPPRSIKIYDDGSLDESIRAEFMKINGRCRLCNEEIPSYLAMAHVYQCREFDDERIKDFCQKYALKLNTGEHTIYNYIILHASYLFQDNLIPNDIIKDISTYRSFTSDIDNLAETILPSFLTKCGYSPSITIKSLKHHGYPDAPALKILSFNHLKT